MIPQSTMNLPWGLKILVILWIKVSFVPGIHCKHETVNQLSREDILLLKDEEDPKCFTRTEQDFTCFFETAENRTYDLLYEIESSAAEKRCKMSVQKTEEGSFLHICTFPASDVLLFVDTHLEVVERNTNTSLYSRTVHVEEHFLLDPPQNVSLHQISHAGQLRISWHAKVPKYWKDHVVYRIRYSSNGLPENIKEESKSTILDSLVPGEEVEVHVTVRCALTANAGHWSSWSQPVRAMVPQSAGDISLTCYTSDLQNITCQWDGSRYGEEKVYKLSYKMSLGEALGWTEWTECPADKDLTDLCRFHGDESRRVRVKLSSTSAPLSRTFYTQEFTLNKSIKTSPPCHLNGTLVKDKLCLKWEVPLRSLSTNLQYEISYQIRGIEGFMAVSLKGSETSTCLEVAAGSQYSIKLRAKPTGPVYSGSWSDWSHELSGVTPIDVGSLLVLCIPVLMLIIVVILIHLFSVHISKLKLYFWPPVPNLDRVLQGFLTELNGPKWNHPTTAKQCSDETASSVVEIMSEDEVSRLWKPSEGSSQLLSPERHSCSREVVDSSSQGTEAFPDYVTLNKDSVILCPKGNKYVYKEVGDKEGPEMNYENFQTCHSSCTDGSVCVPLCLGNDFLNHSYSPVAEPADRFNHKVTVARGPGNLYTNFPCS